MSCLCRNEGQISHKVYLLDCFCVKPHYTTLHYTTLHYTTLHYTTLHYTTIQYNTLLTTCDTCSPNISNNDHVLLKITQIHLELIKVNSFQ